MFDKDFYKAISDFAKYDTKAFLAIIFCALVLGIIIGSLSG